jgi:hypothetical protein
LEKGTIIILVGTVLLAMSIVPMYAFLPANLYWEERPNVASGNSVIQDIGSFVVGGYIKLDVSVYGGDNKISAQVLDTGWNNVTKETFFERNSTITFEAQNNGDYSLFLRNANLTQNDKQVLIKVYYYLYNDIFLISGIIVIALGAVIIFHHGFGKRPSNKQTGPSIPELGH